MIRYRLFILLLTFLAADRIYAQNSSRTISGLVTCFGEATPLEGVLVTVKGTNKISGSQPDGMYYIPVTDRDSVLVFSLSEFQTQEVRLSAASEYDIALRKALQPAGENAGFSPIGSWRGVFQIRPDLEVPFNFEIGAKSGADPEAFFLNAEERFDGGRVTQTSDSLFVFLDQFDNEMAFKIGGKALTGSLRRQDGGGVPIPVTAETGKNYRFEEPAVPPAGNMTGTYDIVFRPASGKEEKAVGLFEQKGNRVRGTFLRITGDSRYLEGVVEGNHFRLSSFFGSGPGYYSGSFTGDGQLTGQITGPRGQQDFTGVLNAKAALPDPYTLTFLKEGYSSFDFSFPDVSGRKISLHDEKFRNKVVIVAIGGTWCPNCVDETAFLAPWYKKNRARGVEIISIQYERQTDPAFVKKVLGRFREKYDIQYDQVFGGIADKQQVAASLPALNTFLAFPTTILIGKDGKVARIHTGYSGPATGKYNEQFEKEFGEEIDSLLR